MENEHCMTEEGIVALLMSIQYISKYCIDVVCYLHTLPDYTFYGNYRDMAKILYGFPKNSSHISKAVKKLLVWEVITEERIGTGKNMRTVSITLNKDWIRLLKKMGRSIEYKI